MCGHLTKYMWKEEEFCAKNTIVSLQTLKNIPILPQLKYWKCKNAALQNRFYLLKLNNGGFFLDLQKMQQELIAIKV